MIELTFDTKDLDNALRRLGGMESRLSAMVRDIVPIVARRIREEVLEYLDETVSLASGRGALVKRAVKAVRNRDGESRFVVASKRLLLGDYDVDPLSVTAVKGIHAKRRSPFTYHLRKQGTLFSSLSTLTGKHYDGSIPFIARSRTGELRVMYRSAKTAEHSTPLLAYAPSVQYHACTPELKQRMEEVSAALFREELGTALERERV